MRYANNTVGYLRISTADQDLAKKNDILHLANSKDLGKVQFIEEVASGKNTWRNRKIAGVLESLKSGDVDRKLIGSFWNSPLI